ncbi:MAG: hypothetical protein ACJAT2_002704 [Bacteriovoracaceae bacterium]|jgi:hypothetical protein
MKHCLIALVALFFFQTAFAKIDLSPFELKPHQISLLLKLEAKGKDDAYLLKMAKGFHLYNTTGSSTVEEEGEYIPPHTADELEEVVHWAKGGGFSAFLSYTNLKMDYKAYQEDCPNWAIFNFGRATGTEFIKVDVLLGAINISSELQYLYAKDPLKFEVAFLKVANREGFDQYFSK